MVDLEKEPGAAGTLCRAAHQRLLTRIGGLSDEVAQSSSRLPGWTIAHVLTHLARNADAHSRRIDGAMAGRDEPKYVGGAQQRRTEIEAGAARAGYELVEDLRDSQARFEEAVDAANSAGWPHGHLLGGGTYPVLACPAHRLREVEMHHVDLGLGYESANWPAAYVEWDLPNLLASVPERLESPEQRTMLTAWLAGRGTPDGVRLRPW